LKRVQDPAFFEPPIIIGNKEHQFLILEALELSGIQGARVILEPEGRNTAPAALTAALTEEEHDILHLLMPSDHVIADRDAFMKALLRASPAAEAEHIVLFGMRPTRPETGYGYILPGNDTSWERVVFIDAFREKPDAEAAADLIRNEALWNSGIFLYTPSVLIGDIMRLAPEYLPICKDALSEAQIHLNCTVLDASSYARIKPDSFDCLIMEKTTHGCVVPCSIGWSDAGSWQSLWQIGKHDAHGNSFAGPVISRDVVDTYARSDGPMLAIVGMKDIAVVATRDAVLIAPRNRSQDIKSMVAEIERQAPSVTMNHTQVLRPWGSYESLAEGSLFQVKHIVVQPDRALSLQQHHHRAEHWIVVGGTAKVERDGVEQLVFPNESVFVPRGTTHRLSNPGKIPLHLIEVQSGDYLGEDDIIRFEDRYGRASSGEQPFPIRGGAAH
jgi:mannose-1-phosphate guanylyltransferase/mannose-6-phosphate isomerase